MDLWIFYKLTFKLYTFFIIITGMDLEQGEKPPTKRRCRGITRKSMIIKNRNRGVKLLIKYNPDGIYVGQAFVHLTSFLGVLAHTMVPIRYNSWRDILI